MRCREQKRRDTRIKKVAFTINTSFCPFNGEFLYERKFVDNYVYLMKFCDHLRTKLQICNTRI